MTTQQTAYSNIRNCAENAPRGSYEQAKLIVDLCGDWVDAIMADLRAMGMRADGSALAFALESAAYQYIKTSNPDDPIWPTAEGFGEHCTGITGRRVIEQAQRDVNALRRASVR